MDAKITKQRLGRMLSYDWLKIIGLIVAVIFVWVLVFTTTATRITPAQQFTVFNHYANGTLPNSFHTFYDNAIGKDVFSHEVLETNTNDLVTAGEYASQILETRFSTDEGDLIYVPQIPDESTAYTDENGQEAYQYNYVESFVYGYGYVLYDLDPANENGYFAQMEKYLEQYYADYTDKNSLNENKVEEDFRARIAKNKDKRYKKEAQIEAGVQDDIARIKKYRDALVEFYAYLDAGYVSLTQVSVNNLETNEPMFSGKYALNLCPDENTMGDLKRHAYYNAKSEDGSASKPTAKNMHALFLKFKGVEEGFQYETLLYVNAVIADSLADGLQISPQA